MSSSGTKAGLRLSTGAEDRRSLSLRLARFVAQSSASTPSESEDSRVHYRRDPTKAKVDRRRELEQADPTA